MVTASGFCTNPLTTYSRKACIGCRLRLSLRGSGRGFDGLLDHAGDGFAGLRAFADPVLGALQIKGEIITLLPGQIRAQFLDELSVAGAAPIRHNDPERGLVLRPDSLQTNFNCHKSSFSLALAESGPFTLRVSPKRDGSLDSPRPLSKPCFRSEEH